MNQIKIGKFIASCRKDKNLTQAQLAEKLFISDRAVSKWENGKSMPDSSIMLSLCGELGISVNELLSGEKIDMENYDKKSEENLIKLKNEQEKINKKMLSLESVIGFTCSITFIVIMFVVGFTKMELLSQIILISVAVIIFLIGLITAINIEQKTGYYECSVCHHKYIPDTAPFLFSMHLGRTRYLKCPKCGRKSWNKKTVE